MIILDCPLGLLVQGEEFEFTSVSNDFSTQK